MDILITGAAGFLGRNLTVALEAIRDGKDRTRPNLRIGKLYLYDRNSPRELLETACAGADMVFHLAGVNRPEDPAEFMAGNRDLTAQLLTLLEKRQKPCPVMLASSVHAGTDTPYGASKQVAEELVIDYGRRTGAEALVYRFPNVFGKWSRPFYNSAVATFCHQISRNLPVTVMDPARELELLYIDDLVAAMLDALEGNTYHNGRFCRVPVTHRATLGRIVELLEIFHRGEEVAPMAPDSFESKLRATYLSYLPPEGILCPLEAKSDHRGSFAELLRTQGCGQFSVIVTKPGQTRGDHWHHSKWEIFYTVSGRGLVRLRKLGSNDVLEIPVFGDRLQGVRMLPGYTHSITNLSDTEDLVTLIWASESFDPARPDTFSEEAGK